MKIIKNISIPKVFLLIIVLLNISYCKKDKDSSTDAAFHKTYYGQGHKNGEVSFFVINMDDYKKTDVIIFTAEGITPDSEPEMFVTSSESDWPTSVKNS
jgi:hypothetical protein